MVGKIAVLLFLGAVNPGDALSFKKSTEGSTIPSFCIFGMCISDKKEYDQSNKIHSRRDETIEDLQKKQEEMDAWKKEDDERKQLEEDEKKAKRQEQKDAIVAQSCQCTWECGDRNDGTVCFRKCCNGEFGGSKQMPGTGPATGAAAATSPAIPGMPTIPGLPDPLSALKNALTPGASPQGAPTAPGAAGAASLPNPLDALKKLLPTLPPQPR